MSNWSSKIIESPPIMSCAMSFNAKLRITDAIPKPATIDVTFTPKMFRY